ncbi:MAG: hypothetical protein US25_C0042G0005 [Candidatus Moranbacteria bacterium GW2011_GWE1_36_7]|nr:MAG: hypothetical protein UR99_C0055G0005 [Candidatus Moranbacteria bacterium GW2011_GWD2_36_12]KKQ13136.1 MAG: hypothetical protein US25_C0042G0005 [Candidatus Moranbacteria bacterium GW2011_GWE1_36_7]
MFIQSIEITCPHCKNEFSDRILLSLSSSHYEIAKKSGVLEPTRECPNCHMSVELEGNYVRTEPVFTLKQRIWRWFDKFLP